MESRGTIYKQQRPSFLTYKKGLLLECGGVSNKLSEEHGLLGPGSLDLHAVVPLTRCDLGHVS